MMETCPSQQGNALACAMPAGHGGVHWQHPENRGCWWNDEMATTPGSIPLAPNAQPPLTSFAGEEPPIPAGMVVDLRGGSACGSQVTDPADGANWQCDLPYGHTGEHRWDICLTDPARTILRRKLPREVQGPVLPAATRDEAGPSLEVLQLGEAAYLTVCYTSASRLDDLRRVAFVLLAEIVRREARDAR